MSIGDALNSSRKKEIMKEPVRLILGDGTSEIVLLLVLLQCGLLTGLVVEKDGMNLDVLV